jgi:hypothetical protein
MATWRFVQAADLHLDSPFVDLPAEDPALGRLLRVATFRARS